MSYFIGPNDLACDLEQWETFYTNNGTLHQHCD